MSVRQGNNVIAGSPDEHKVIEFQAPTAQNNYTWYRKYADGWVEQGGNVVAPATVTLPIAMADTNYTLLKTMNNDYSGNIGGATWSSSTAVKVSSTQIRLNQTNGGDQQGWLVCGVAA